MTQEKSVKIVGLMTAPRYEPVWARGIIERALSRVGIPLAVSGGVFYGQCMQRMMCDAISSGAEYILTVDFDSIFTENHVKRLLNFVVGRDDIDAICAIQPKRGAGTILGTRGQHEEIEWTGEPIPLRSAHFGLTVLDAKKLEKVELPWFANKCDANGQWVGDDKIDDDVWFWKQWEKAGNTIYTDPGCRLGHLEEVVTVFDPDMNLKHIYPNQWEKFSASTVG
jgi:hypothetical protein